MKQYPRAFLALAILTVWWFVPTSRDSGHAATSIGPKTYYLSLGDSIAFGQQPSGLVNYGYSDDLYDGFLAQGTSQLINMGCPGETSTTFVKGGCSYANSVKYQYSGAQLNAALTFIRQHPGQVSPVTVDLGTNDLKTLFSISSCSEASQSQVNNALSTFDKNVNLILSQVRAALGGSGDLLMMTNYFAHQNQCPNLVQLDQLFNSHIVADAQQNGTIVADVFTAFGGATTPNPNLCNYTGICYSSPDIHPTNQGYQVIAQTFDQAADYPQPRIDSGNFQGVFGSQGESDSYTFVPGDSGTARVASCNVNTGDVVKVALLDAHGRVLSIGGASSYCSWASAGVAGGSSYTVTTTAVSGSGTYRSSWDINGAQVIWNLGGSLSSSGSSQIIGVPILTAGSVSLSTCGPPGAVFELFLLDANDSILASSTVPSNCQTVGYTPAKPDIYRLGEYAQNRGGHWYGTLITDQGNGGSDPSPTPTSTSTATPTLTPTSVPGSLSGTKAGNIPNVGSSDSYTFTPAQSGTASVGTCAINTSDVFTVDLYDSSGHLLASGTSSSYCNWASASVSANHTYTIRTNTVVGAGNYRSSWSVNGAQVVWQVGGSIGSAGTQQYSIPTLSAGPIIVNTCGPSGTVFSVSILDTNGATLASANANSNCQTLDYTPSSRSLFRLREAAVSGSGAWSGTIGTQ